jgi:hypothetical protein
MKERHPQVRTISLCAIQANQLPQAQATNIDTPSTHEWVNQLSFQHKFRIENYPHNCCGDATAGTTLFFSGSSEGVPSRRTSRIRDVIPTGSITVVPAGAEAGLTAGLQVWFDLID